MRTTAALTTRLEGLLAPLGFVRQKGRWNRRSGRYIDVIDIQVSKAGDAVTVNSGVMDPEVYKRCWDADPPASVEEPFCTVRTRIGRLIGNRDVWWPVADPATPEIVVAEVAENVVAFLDRMHSRDAMVEFLSASDQLKKRDPASMINLAILKHDVGDKSGACSLLDELQTTVLGAWRGRASDVSTRLGCR